VSVVLHPSSELTPCTTCKAPTVQHLALKQKLTDTTKSVLSFFTHVAASGTCHMAPAAGSTEGRAQGDSNA
jgi:hypothetical protein